VIFVNVLAEEVEQQKSNLSIDVTNGPDSNNLNPSTNVTLRNATAESNANFTTTAVPLTSSTTTTTTTTTTQAPNLQNAVEQEKGSSLSIFFVLCVIALGILLVHCMLQTHFQYLPESIVTVCLGALIGK
jgi:sodium/hydrogen exchanger 8